VPAAPIVRLIPKVHMAPKRYSNINSLTGCLRC